MDRRLIRSGLLIAVVFGLLVAGPMAWSDVKLQRYDAEMGVHAQNAPRRRSADRPTPTPSPQPTLEQSANSAALATPPSQAVEVRIGDSALTTVIGGRLSPVVYGLTIDGDLFRSADSGNTWNLMALGSEASDFVMSPADPRVLYRGDGLTCDAADAVTQPFYRSDDGGVTWTRIPIGDNLIPLLAHPQDAEVLLAADCDMLYVTEDGGESWQARPDLSTNALWERYRALQVTASSQVSDLPAGSANWYYLYAAGADADGSGMVAYTGDIGENWERITPRLSPEPTRLSAITADPFTAGRLWFADANGLWYTEDFGMSWQLMRLELADALAPDVEIDVTALAVGSDDVVYAGTTIGLFQGDGVDGEWTPVDDEVLQGVEVESLLPISGESSVLWINAADGVYRYSVPHDRPSGE